MVLFYIKKIQNKEMNYQTEDVWKVENVPTLWRAKVELELSE